MVLAVLEDNVADYVDAMQRIRRRERGAGLGGADAADEAVRTEAENELQQVAAILVDDDLRNRYKLKATSKAPIFTDLEWDIKVKIDDSSLGGEECHLPYATLKFVYQREFGATAYAPLSMQMAKAFEAVSINVTADDLEYLEQYVSLLRQRLLAQAKSGDAK
jgi:hypothetical protein